MAVYRLSTQWDITLWPSYWFLHSLPQTHNTSPDPVCAKKQPTHTHPRLARVYSPHRLIVWRWNLINLLHNNHSPCLPQPTSWTSHTAPMSRWPMCLGQGLEAWISGLRGKELQRWDKPFSTTTTTTLLRSLSWATFNKGSGAWNGAEGQCRMRSSAIHQADLGQIVLANNSLSACTCFNLLELQGGWGLPCRWEQLLK